MVSGGVVNDDEFGRSQLRSRERFSPNCLLAIELTPLLFRMRLLREFKYTPYRQIVSYQTTTVHLKEVTGLVRHEGGGATATGLGKSYAASEIKIGFVQHLINSIFC